MRRILVLALSLLFAPALASAQVEIGFDGGLSVYSEKDAEDKQIDFDLPIGDVRIAFPAGENVLVESIVDFEWYKEGDYKSTYFSLLPGLTYLVNEQFYVRGEVGLERGSFDNGTTDGSYTQYIFGGAAGIRQALGEGAILRLEGGLDRYTENSDEGIPAAWLFKAVVGVSAVVN